MSGFPASPGRSFLGAPGPAWKRPSPPEVDFVMSAIVGVAGLEATYEAIRRGKRVGLANKEVLVASGKLVIEAAKEIGDRADSSG